ncbi:DUF418 domain-containing protein [Rhodococcus maanshanensis]|jgi:uncharacterized protein|uniref:DUF418 domain-containing protein n=1 Tax=Rhodococcus maanshanensis TaxID=183556 RepID=UPI0022B51962|nr:DUF418 domain-containing protein [Rhodococcus maanshanensis]MCZ4557848.1 DUF418 domain-containing protein [Rhodococcus maanshanensis]
MTTQIGAPAVSRIEALDVLRGFALGGILMVNITVMSTPGGFADGPAQSLIAAIFHNKFYVIFSFLFGYSLTMQIRSAKRAGASPRARTVRRCLALMAVGLVHYVFFFSGDILFCYGVMGLILLALSSLRPRTALIAAAVPFSISVIGMTVLGMIKSAAATGSAQDAETARELAAMQSGWLDAAHYRWENFTDNIAAFLLISLLSVLPLFLVGLAAGKVRLLERPERYRPLLRPVQWIGFGVAAPISVLSAVTEMPILTGPNALASPVLAAAYGATVLRVMDRHPSVARVLAPAGKLAATNYIGQSVVTAIIFTGYGFALVGRLSDWAVLGIAASVYAIQLVVSAWWVRRHRYGPVEWVLRMATYGRSRSR